MVTEVVVKVPDAEVGSDMSYIHDAAKALSQMTASGNVELREAKTFKPINDAGEGGDNWPTYIIEATCSKALFDSQQIREIHYNLVRHLDVPDEVAIETQVASEDIHLVG